MCGETSSIARLMVGADASLWVVRNADPLHNVSLGSHWLERYQLDSYLHQRYFEIRLTAMLQFTHSEGRESHACYAKTICIMSNPFVRQILSPFYRSRNRSSESYLGFQGSHSWSLRDANPDFSGFKFSCYHCVLSVTFNQSLLFVGIISYPHFSVK